MRDLHAGRGLDMPMDRLWVNARLATMNPTLPGLGVIEPGAIAAQRDRIGWVGQMHELPHELKARETIDLEGRWVTPGLIDCHTHLVYGGSRAAEFDMRLAGAAEAEIARLGGGVLSTVQATRAATQAELRASALQRLDPLIAEGVTTVEIKSGYGLDLETELKMLRVARGLEQARPISVSTSCLAAQTLPPEFVGDRVGYLRLVVEVILPAIAAAGLADAVDGVVERTAFSPHEIRGVFEKARTLGLPVRLHADQLSNLRGAALAAEFGGLSADHLLYADEAAIAAMAEAGTVAVLLPGPVYFRRQKQVPPIEVFRRLKVPMAIGSDSDPGTSPITSLLTTLNLAAMLFRLTVEECLAGVTREAARALGRLGEVGTLEAGRLCDLAIWDIDQPAELVYPIGLNPLHRRVWRGH
ncbi:MAG: imidazolonepropionase [Devosia sp.]|nr:imidazolonepropionase [Devosia sp.]